MQRKGQDYLTGLWTRQQLYESFGLLDANAKLQFMFMDLDNFKNVNDVYGHQTGDELLCAVGRILRTVAPLACPIRLGGDEFVLLFEGTYQKDELAQMAAEIIRRVEKHEGFEHVSIYVSASIGILLNETAKETLDAILAKSDIAMYYAKNHGKATYIFYEEIEESILREKEMERRQEKALHDEEFVVRYLPMVSPQNSKMVMSQACVFWRQPDGTFWRHNVFNPVFARNGFIRHLDDWTIDRVLDDWERIQSQMGKSVQVAVSVSRACLLQENFVKRLEEKVKAHGILPQNLILEVTEYAFVRGKTAILETFKELKSRNFSICVIDVGSDFKTLAYWNVLELDAIVLDTDFVKTFLQTARGRQVIKMLLVTGRELKMKVMVKGIVSKEDKEFLERCGCSAIAGPSSNARVIDEYVEAVRDYIVGEEIKYEFRFQHSYDSVDGEIQGILLGNGVSFVPGISDAWGGLSFAGGNHMENVLELPNEVLAGNSFTICMWLKPSRLLCWSSVFYARYRNMFTSFVPYTEGGNNIYRVRDDADIDGWYDALSRYIPDNTWSFICLTYDDASATIRTYLNGRKAGHRTDIPSLMACRQIIFGGDPFQPSYEGELSGLIIFQDVKTEEEIEQLYVEFTKEFGYVGEKENFWMTE